VVDKVERVPETVYTIYGLRGLDWTDTYDLPPYFWLHIQDYVRFTEKLVLLSCRQTGSAINRPAMNRTKTIKTTFLVK
jgi:hypothetical protein